MSKADIHCHSTHSDGSYTPLELVALAKKSGLTGLAITDHDAISAFSEIQDTELQLLSGVELSTTFGEIQVHILGYAFDIQSSVIREFCSACREQRVDRNKVILEKLSAKGFKLQESDIRRENDVATAYGRPHIAQAMLKKGYVKNIQEAFRRYIGEGKSCYIPGKKYTTQECIDVVHQAGGKAVIAHPHLLPGQKVVNELLELNFDGIEVYYSQFPESMNAKWLRLAEEKGLFATGGSDFHGTMKPDVKLGSSICPEASFKMLWDHFQSHR